jgi:hypothetical protein
MKTLEDFTPSIAAKIPEYQQTFTSNGKSIECGGIW